MSSRERQADFFIDGQNLFLSVKGLFGYKHPNFDVVSLCKGLAETKGWEVGKIQFYTGIPSRDENPHWHDYWSRRLAEMGQVGVEIFNPPLRYCVKREELPDGSVRCWTQATEKCVDIRIALDMVKRTLDGRSALVLLTQDNDLSVAAVEAHDMARRVNRSIQVACAYPAAEGRPFRGIEGTSWITMNRAFCDRHNDPRDYRSPGMKHAHDGQRHRQEALQDPRLNAGHHRSTAAVALHRVPPKVGTEDSSAEKAASPIHALDAEWIQRAEMAVSAIPSSTSSVTRRP